MKGEMKLTLARPLLIYAVFWILTLMFINQLGLDQSILGVHAPTISVPRVSQESMKVVTQDFMKITGYNVDDDTVSFYIYAGTVEENVIISVYVDGYRIKSLDLPPYYEYIHPVSFRLESGSHTISVKKEKDLNILDNITWTVVIP